MVRRDRTKINNLRDDLKKFQNNLWELENSDSNLGIPGFTYGTLKLRKNSSFPKLNKLI